MIIIQILQKFWRGGNSKEKAEDRNFKLFSDVHQHGLLSLFFSVLLYSSLVALTKDRIDQTWNKTSCIRIWNTDQEKNHSFFSALYA